mmetsp:Transcript_25071/g.87439  ORF Transcript_25071/g.87439 Transcript_25071/m.87439 type:complete len:347 (+) Transcript_25071:242-1282(+)
MALGRRLLASRSRYTRPSMTSRSGASWKISAPPVPPPTLLSAARCKCATTTATTAPAIPLGMAAILDPKKPSTAGNADHTFWVATSDIDKSDAAWMMPRYTTPRLWRPPLSSSGAPAAKTALPVCGSTYRKASHDPRYESNHGVPTSSNMARGNLAELITAPSEKMTGKIAPPAAGLPSRSPFAPTNSRGYVVRAPEAPWTMICPQSTPEPNRYPGVALSERSVARRSLCATTLPAESTSSTKTAPASETSPSFPRAPTATSTPPPAVFLSRQETPKPNQSSNCAFEFWRVKLMPLLTPPSELLKNSVSRFFSPLITSTTPSPLTSQSVTSWPKFCPAVVFSCCRM